MFNKNTVPTFEVSMDSGRAHVGGYRSLPQLTLDINKYMLFNNECGRKKRLFMKNVELLEKSVVKHCPGSNIKPESS